jgi:hypothetical protein
MLTFGWVKPWAYVEIGVGVAISIVLLIGSLKAARKHRADRNPLRGLLEIGEHAIRAETSIISSE